MWPGMESFMTVILMRLLAWEGRTKQDKIWTFGALVSLPSSSGTHSLTQGLTETADDLTEYRIQTGKHCFGCTAGAGSSCGGALD